MIEKYTQFRQFTDLYRSTIQRVHIFWANCDAPKPGTTRGTGSEWRLSLPANSQGRGTNK